MIHLSLFFIVAIAAAATPPCGKTFVSQHVVGSEAWRSEFDFKFGAEMLTIIRVRRYTNSSGFVSIYKYDNGDSKVVLFDSQLTYIIEASDPSIAIDSKSIRYKGKTYTYSTHYEFGPLYGHPYTPQQLPPAP